MLLLAVVLEAARHDIGWPLPVIAALALAYGLRGKHIPGELGYSGTPLGSFLGMLVIAEGELWGSLTGVSVSVVAIVVIFGAVLMWGMFSTGLTMEYAACMANGAGAAMLAVDSRLSLDWRRTLARAEAACIIPLGMIAHPEIIALGTAPGSALFAAIKIAVGLAAISYGASGCARGWSGWSWPPSLLRSSS